MPHIISEYSSNLPYKIIKSIEKKFLSEIEFLEGNFKKSDCKFRSISFDEYSISDLAVSDSSFIHLSIKILSSRSIEIRKKLSEKVFEIAEKIILTANFDFKIHLSVDVVEMEKEVYRKILIKK